MDEETGKPLIPGEGDTEVRPVGEEELKSMSAFTDFIETLNLDDLGKEQKPPASSA